MNEFIQTLEVAQFYFQENIHYWYMLNAILGMCFASCVGLIVARWPAKMEYQEALMFINYWEDKNGDKNNEHYLKCKKMTEKKPDGFFFPNSRCDHCGETLKLWHNIPIIGWLSLGGKCAFCKTKIPFSVLGAEIIGGLLGCLIAWLVGDVSIYTFMWLIIAAYFSAVSWLDWKTLFLPTASLSYFVFFIFILCFQNLTGSFLPTPAESLAGAMVGYGILFVINEGYYLIRKIRGFGEGDYYLLAAFGACFGVEKVILTFMISIFVGVFIALFAFCYDLIISNKNDSENNKLTTVEGKKAIPFGPSISIAAMITIIMFKLNIFYTGFILF